MRRSLWWVALSVLVLVAAPLVPLFAVPATVARAEPSAPAALPHDEVVVLSSSGEILAYDLYPQTGMKDADWASADTGWESIAAGDFNHDGDQEIAAIGGGRLKIFDPFVQPGKTQVAFDFALDGGRYFRLITTGDFDGDGRDEIAATATEYIEGFAETLRIYDGGANGTSWSEIGRAYYGAQWQAMAAGDFLNSGADDLAMVRNPGWASPYLMVLNGRDWSTIAEREDSYPWVTLAAGKLDSLSSPDQLALLRTGVGGDLDGLIMFNVYNGGMEDVFPSLSGGFRHFPNFTSLALGTQVAGRERQIFELRDDWNYYGTALLRMEHPTDVALNDWEVALDYGVSPWRQVRTGDVDGDGLSEVVIVRSDRFRVYTQPGINYGKLSDVLGSFLVQPDHTDWPVMVMANIDGPGIPSAPALSVSPASLSYDLQYGATSPVRTLAITNVGTAASITWQAQVTAGNSWLNISGPAGGGTPGQVNVTVNTTVAPDSYTGNIRITAPDTSVLNRIWDIPVTFNLANPGFVVVPQQLYFRQQIGSPTVVTKEVQILRPDLPTNWTATALPLGSAVNVEQLIASGRITVKDGRAALDGVAVDPPAWLVFTPDSGTTPSTMKVSTQAAATGRYRAAIVVAAQDPTVVEPVRWVEVDLDAAQSFTYLPQLMR